MSHFFYLKDIHIKEANESGKCVCVIHENNLLAVKISKVLFAEFVSSCTSLISGLSSGVIRWFYGLSAVKWTKSSAHLLVRRRLFELKDADLKVRRWDAGIDNKAVLVVAAERIVEPVLIIQLESCRSKADQSEEKVDDFHFSFLFLMFCWMNCLMNFPIWKAFL